MCLTNSYSVCYILYYLCVCVCSRSGVRESVCVRVEWYEFERVSVCVWVCVCASMCV